MSSIQILQGDFKKGAVELLAEGIRLRTGSITTAIVPFGAILKITNLGSERHATSEDKIATTVAGGIIGGIAAGSLAGGLTGPAGAVLGAVAGAIISVKRLFATRRVELRDGRTFIAKGQVSDWIALENLVSRAEPLPQVKIADGSSIEPAEPSIFARAFLSIQKRLPRRKTLS